MSNGYTIIPDQFLELDLTLSELVCLSVIYGFSQDKESWFTGTQAYLAKKCKCSKTNLNFLLRKLEDKGLIETRREGNRAYYRCDFGTLTKVEEYTEQVEKSVKNFNQDEESQLKNLTKSVKNFNCIKYNKIYNKTIDKESVCIDELDAPPQQQKAMATNFKKPTLQEVKSYCDERGSVIDAQRFFDYYTANGWRVGRNPMRDWKAAVRNWERSETKIKARDNPTESIYEHNLQIAQQLLNEQL